MCADVDAGLGKRTLRLYCRKPRDPRRNPLLVHGPGFDRVVHVRATWGRGNAKGTTFCGVDFVPVGNHVVDGWLLWKRRLPGPELPADPDVRRVRTFRCAVCYERWRAAAAQAVKEDEQAKLQEAVAT